MPAETQKQANTARLAIAVKAGAFPKSKAGPAVKQMAKSMSRTKLKHFTKVKECMTEAQKQRLLSVLKTLKEEHTGNVGGEVGTGLDADGPPVNEDEFTARSKPEPNVVAQTYDTEADFDSYVRIRRGIEMTSKELEAIANFREIRPIKQDKFSVEFRTTDDFGNNDRTIIKKLLQDRTPTWVAFSTHETAEEEGKPDDQKAEEEPSGEEEGGGEEPELPPLTESDKGSKLDKLQLALDIIGLDPEVLGVAADSTNSIISLFRAAKDKEPDERRKHLIDAAISAVSIIPFADVVKLIKLRKLRKPAVKVARMVKRGASASPKSYSVKEQAPTQPQQAAPATPSQPQPPPKPEEDDNTFEVKDPIRVTKSITFQGDDGADVLTDFLQKLDI